jgi:hypothetical protein
LTLDPAFGICASTATARGSGFAPGATVRITSAQVGADAVSTAADGIAVAQDGTFGVLLHAPEQLGCAEQPDALPGQVLNVRAMTVTGETQSATAAFLVAPHLPSEIQQAAGLPSCGAAQLVEGVIPQPNPDYDCLVSAYQTGGSAQFVVRWDDAGVVLVSFFLLQPGQPIDLWVGRYNETMDDFAWSREACVGLDLEHGLIGIANCVITSPDPTPTP